MESDERERPAQKARKLAQQARNVSLKYILGVLSLRWFESCPLEKAPLEVAKNYKTGEWDVRGKINIAGGITSMARLATLVEAGNIDELQTALCSRLTDRDDQSHIREFLSIMRSQPRADDEIFISQQAVQAFKYSLDNLLWKTEHLVAR